MREAVPARAGADRPAALHRLLRRSRRSRPACPPTRARRSSTRSPARTSGSRRSCRSSRKYGAAVIGLANDDEIPMEPERRRRGRPEDRLGRRRLRHPARGHRSSTRSRCPSAPSRAPSTLFFETLHLLRDELGVNTTCGASNTSLRLARAGTRWRRTSSPSRRARADERDHGRALAGVVEAVRATDFLHRPRRVRHGAGSARSAARQAAAAAAASDPEVTAVDEPSPSRRRRASACTSRSRRRDEGRVSRRARRVFDGASWNGIAIDSTCGGHGTCKKCKVQVVSTAPCRSGAVDRARSRPTSCATAGGSPAARSPTRTSGRRPAAADAPEGGAGRRRPPRDPAAGGDKRYLELSEPDMEDQLSDLERVRAAIDDFELQVDLDVLRTLGKTLRDGELEGHRGDRRRRADRRRARRHHRAPRTRSPSTSARRPWSRRCSTCRARGRLRPCARSSTSSSPSAPT